MGDPVEDIKARLLGRTFSAGGVSPWHYNDIEFLLAEISHLRTASPSEEEILRRASVIAAEHATYMNTNGIEGAQSGTLDWLADRLAALRTTKEGEHE